MKLDPYETLGLSRDATDEEVQAAGKMHARKWHPDVGGDPDEFMAGRRALIVLSHPAKRGKYDRTGVMDDDTPNNTLAEARGLIDRCVGEAVSAFLAKEDPTLDPRNLNLIDIFKTVIRAQIAHSEGEITKLDRQSKFFKDFAGRFKMKKDKGDQFDFLKRRFDDEFRRAADSRAQLVAGIEMRKMALEIIDTYEFQHDPPPPPAPQPVMSRYSTRFASSTNSS